MGSQLPPAPSGYPILKHAVQFARDPFEFVERATTECGDIYRMDLPAVDDVFVLAHPDYFNRVLVTDVEAFEKTEDYRRAFGNGLLSAEGQQWRRQREMMQPLFYREQIRGYTDQMVACTERRLETWGEDEIRDMETEMRDLTLEILFATLFGRELIPGEDQELRDAADGLNEWFTPSSWILPPWIPTPARRRFEHSTKRLRQEVRTLLAEGSGRSVSQSTGLKEASPRAPHNPEQVSPCSETPDLLTQLQRARDAKEGPQLTTKEIEDQLITMVFAGHETTATALAFTLYVLATQPDIREQFQQELDTVLDGDPPSYNDLQNLVFTEQIITEALRLYPPIHTIPRQTMTDVEINGYRLPEGHEIHLSVIHVHRDEQFYDEPLSFRPTRWSDEFEEGLHDFAYAPFGSGRRSCIGREFALLEAKVVLATIGQQFQFDWERDQKLTLEPRVTTQTKEGIPLKLANRS
ncbi:cytochrome P450 [Natrialba sp. SSL1]|uniref:cytochrome P450 n=1 Tax=Natrialba sp. SSL1 TaxID=1869245 RepID=UPI0008F8CACA|nr:cytochrome P450 [Natrialba sp. SSL1]OIB57337.1 cytochrome P450 [Natrialba sp. SSL1]